MLPNMSVYRVAGSQRKFQISRVKLCYSTSLKGKKYFSFSWSMIVYKIEN